MLEMGSSEASGHQEVLVHALDLQLTIGLSVQGLYQLGTL